MQALPHLADGTHTLVLYGDVPLVSAATLRAPAGRRRPRSVGLLTVLLDDPARLRPHRPRRRPGAAHRRGEGRDAGRARDARGQYRHPRRADPPAETLAGAAVRQQRAARVLPDRHRRAGGRRRRGGARSRIRTRSTRRSASIPRRNWRSSSGCTSAATPTALLERGVTLADPARIDVRGDLSWAPTCSSMSAACSKGASMLGDGVRIGPHNVLRDCSIGAGTEVLRLLLSRERDDRCAGAHRPVCAHAPDRDAGRRSAHRQFRRGEELDDGRRLQGQPPRLCRRRDRRPARQYRRRHDHRQLRRRQQAPPR